MAYKLGDFVRFVEEDFEGHITKIINDELVGVTGEDGFEIPVQTTKITHVYGQQSRKELDFDEDKKQPTVISGAFVGEGIYLAITGDQKQNIAIFNLVNETSYDLLLSFSTEKAKQIVGEYAGIIAPKSTQKIYNAKISEVSSWPLFDFKFLFHTAMLQAPKPALEITKRIKPLDLSEAKKHVPLLNDRAWLFRLDEDLKIDAEKLKESFFSHRPDKK